MGCLYNQLVLFGVFLPLVAWGVENYTHICAEVFFDPLPTSLHQLLWLCVPLSNFWLTRVLKGQSRPRVGLGLVCGLAQGVLIIYALLFLPLLPISLLALIFWGMGFCSLSPLLALPVSLLAFRRVARERERPSGRLLGVALAILLLTLAELPSALTYVGLQLARSASPERGLQLLRDYGDQQLLLRSCYQQVGWNNSLMGMVICLGSPPSPEVVRELFYRVNGTPFNAYPPPPNAARFWDEDFDWSWDGDQAGEQVGGRVRQLNLQESRLQGRVDPTATTVVWKWDLVFANGAGREREARAQLRLPAGGVATGALLWVKDQPREALIASRAKARQAYEEVVSQRRDPLLVTTNGPGRLMVQCFPVPSQGTMHIQLTVTAPAHLEAGEAWLKPPAILERNFGLNAPHQIELECNLPWQGKGGLERGQVAAGGLGSPELLAVIARPPAPAVWCSDPYGGYASGTVARAGGTPRPIWIVIDGSASMLPYQAVVARALRKFRSPQAVGVLLAGDRVRTLMPLGPAEPARLEEAARALEELALVGGQDAVPALMQAQGTEVLWIHAGQPVLLADLSALREHSRSLLSLSCTSAPNRVLDQLGCREALRTGSLESDLGRALQFLSGQSQESRLALTHSDRQPGGTRTPVDDLSRLWALVECARLPDQALKLAVRYHLVTPVSGAVVLESREQEERLGLRPASLDTAIPVVPEPGFWLLLATLAALLALRGTVRRPR